MRGVVKNHTAQLDHEYPSTTAQQLNIADLLHKVLAEAGGAPAE